jgi:transcriptional regulator of acetoin/glycerol metabolism
MNIDPHRTAPYIGDTAGGERVRRAASPVIDELCGLMLGVSTGVVLTDEEAQVLDMRTGDPDLSAYFEENGGLIGSGWSEELMGTSAIALAVKLGKPMLVSGDEHYVAGLKDCTAAAAPIFDPFHRKLVGALILSGRERASSPHMLPAVVQAAKAVEQRLYEDASPTEHPLLERFLAAVARTPNEAVFALNERMVLSNQAATELLRAVERSTLWHQALDTVAGIRGTEATNLLTLRDGRSLDAAFEKADSESARAGILVRVAPNEGEADASGSRATTMAPRAPSQSPDCYLEQRIAGSVWLASGLLITGEPGSGKLTTAEEIHRRSGREKLAILDGATDPGNGGPGILRDLSASASDPGITVIVRHAECLSQRALTTIRSVLSDHGARLIATMTVAADAEEPSDLRDLFPHQVQVPPLRDRLEDLAAIVG